MGVKARPGQRKREREREREEVAAFRRQIHNSDWKRWSYRFIAKASFSLTHLIQAELLEGRKVGANLKATFYKLRTC